MMELDKPEQTSVNDSRTLAASDTRLTRACSADVHRETIRDLIALAVKHGPDTPVGHRAYTLVELTQNLPGSDRERRAHIVSNIQRINRELAGLLAAAR